MIARRLAALALSFALFAAACSDDGGSTTSTDGDPPIDDSADGDGTQAAEGGGGDETTGDGGHSDDKGATGSGDGADDVGDPTVDGQPLDLDGGATSSDDGVFIVTDDPNLELAPGIGQAVSPWPTDWTRRTIDISDLLLGIAAIDPRDRIRPIDTPVFESMADASEWVGEREPGALLDFNGEVRFYPLSILTRHEIVNDRVGDVPVAVTFCPLCNTALTFDRRVDGEVLRFGVSGLLRNSDLVMWDDRTVSLWQQVTGEGIVGELAGTRLEVIPTAIVSFGDALDSFPEARSLSRLSGGGGNYGVNPYAEYSSSERPFLFDGEPDPRYPALSRVVGVTVGDVEKAYPFETLTTERVINDEIDGIGVAVMWGSDTADALDITEIADAQTIGTGIAFDRTVDGQLLTFSAAAGADLFADAETGTTWNLLGQAVDGPLAGTRLETLTHRNEFWFAWAAFFPDGIVHGE